jgi:hypothetical protein
MKIFNRIAVILLLAGLFLLGVYTVVYSFDLLGYRLADLAGTLNLPGIYSGIQGFVSRVENGSPSLADVAVLVLLALIGLILLLLELKPPSPKHVRMQRGAYITRDAVKEEATRAAEQAPNVLGVRTNVKARRRSGANVELRADVRRGEDLGSIRSDLGERVRQHLARSGVPLNKLKLKLIESDPRETRTRVK